MKQLRYLIPFIFVFSLFLPMALFAQESSTLSILDAIAVVKAEYGEDLVIRSISYETEEACWDVELVDGTEFCIDEATGEIIADTEDAEETPEAEMTEEVDDADDDAQDDDSSTVSPAISLEEAIAAAQAIFPNSSITNIELDTLDNGMLVWDIEFADGRSTDVDASTGAVLSYGYESQDDNSYAEDDDGQEADDNSDDGDDDGQDDDDEDDDDDDEQDGDDDDGQDDDEDDGDDD